MENIILEFTERTKEIDRYFSFVENVIKDEASLYFKDRKRRKVKKIDGEIQKILKANSFILLYNLIESSFKSTLESLCDEINNSETSYDNLIPEVKKMWLEYESEYFTKKPKQSKKLDHVYSIINDLTNYVLTIPRTLDGIGISGNVDGKKIKECVKAYGLTSKAIMTKPAGKLLTVKTQRNNLAHGDVSFSDCGRNYTFDELSEIKKEVFSYMKFVLNVFNKNIKRKYYLQ
ncbi:MAE_28990/MAE_18760 family HEPN-like nuclease [Psychromonas sp. L1A2]|uniref:MAE_28990/MAE_18760 family HEPN-like nuclease n=1 Tax=Psychromonas sp. L1A2 TaxID=2686356 RepID=UPI00135748D5|nr:MAE_28990/MAE_18760 family HEPN-like nuclease [Psychromonas sp. L1A2]